VKPAQTGAGRQIGEIVKLVGMLLDVTAEFLDSRRRRV
jgi:hypothetical protein